MNNKGVSISYGAIAVGAKESFVPSASEKADFINLDVLQNEFVTGENFGNPCEPYQTVLNDEAYVLNENPWLNSPALGFWSEQLSDSVGNFQEPINLTFESDKLFSSAGITLIFDEANNIYPMHLNIHWYRELNGAISDLGSVDFFPDSSNFFCENSVEDYNKLEITFFSLNMPFNRLRLWRIDYGFGKIFVSSELRNVSLSQQYSPISDAIPIGTADIILDSKASIQYDFAEKQPLKIFFNDEFQMLGFVKTAKQTAKNIWKIQCEDVVSVLEDTPYAGGIYKNALALEIIQNIFSVANIDFGYYEDVEAKAQKISGYIPYTNCREALLQVLFAIQARIDAYDGELPVIKEHSYDSISQHIPLRRIMQGQFFSDEKKVEAVELTSHSYTAISEETIVYSATDDGTGQNIFIKFDEPLHDLSITNGDILESGANFAIINANANCVLTGKQYKHTIKTKRMGKNSAQSDANVVSITDATLISNSNIDFVLERCYNWLVKNRQTQMRIVQSPNDMPVRLGDKITYDTEYLGSKEGILIEQRYNLNGGVIIKEAVLK